MNTGKRSSTIEAMKQALYCVEAWERGCERDAYWRDIDECITALRAAIEQAEKQEPVALMVYTLDGTAAWVTLNPADFTDEHRALPLYTTPPAPSPDPLHLSRILHELAGAASMCWTPAPTGVFDSQEAIKHVEAAIEEIRARSNT